MNRARFHPIPLCHGVLWQGLLWEAALPCAGSAIQKPGVGLPYLDSFCLLLDLITWWIAGH